MRNLEEMNYTGVLQIGVNQEINLVRSHVNLRRHPQARLWERKCALLVVAAISRVKGGCSEPQSILLFPNASSQFVGD